MIAAKQGVTLPGWRDFERAVALSLGGIPSENKDIMDVRLPDPRREGVFFGISCKMRRELHRVRRDGRVTIELTNAARAFQNRLSEDGINLENFRSHPKKAGIAVVNLVRAWHTSASVEDGGDVDLEGSCYLTLMWDARGEYKLHQFNINLPDPNDLDWNCPLVTRKGAQEIGNHISASDEHGTIFEWYGQSGGQLKYYPHVDNSIWASDTFTLESLPPNTPHGLLSKARQYYPEQWPSLPH